MLANLEDLFSKRPPMVDSSCSAENLEKLTPKKPEARSPPVVARKNITTEKIIQDYFDSQKLNPNVRLVKEPLNDTRPKNVAIKITEGTSADQSLPASPRKDSAVINSPLKKTPSSSISGTPKSVPKILVSATTSSVRKSLSNNVLDEVLNNVEACRNLEEMKKVLTNQIKNLRMPGQGEAVHNNSEVVVNEILRSDGKKSKGK